MRYVHAAAVVALFFAFSAVTSFAQGCGGWMTKYYSAYVSTSAGNISANSYTLYTKSTVDGYTSGTCPIGCGCVPTPTHHGWVPAAIKNHTTGATIASAQTVGPNVCYNCYISVSQPLNIVGVPGVVYDYSSSNYIICSKVGTFFAAYVTGGISLRMSAYVSAGMSGGRCVWSETCTGACSSPHTTNTNSQGGCWSIVNGQPVGPYKQCWDLYAFGKCVLYRPLCLGRTNPGVCS